MLRWEENEMANWNSYDKLGITIKRIMRCMGGDGDATVYVIDELGDSYELYFDNAFDFRYTTKAAFGDTLERIPTELLESASIFAGTESDYLKRFDHEVIIIPIETMVHFALFDETGYGVELLSFPDPVLTKLGYDLSNYAYPKLKLGPAASTPTG
jgi:hypothetical protein